MGLTRSGPSFRILLTAERIEGFAEALRGEDVAAAHRKNDA